MEHNAEVRLILRRMVDLLAREYQSQKVILFSFYLSGEIHADSDVDLLVIKETNLPFYKRGAQVRKLIRPMRRSLPIDIIVLTPLELNAQLERGNGFLAQVLENREVLFG